MNHFMEYVCRGIVRSEDNIRRLNKSIVKLAKCNNQLATAVICMGIAGILTMSVIAIQDQEIKALQKQVAELATAKTTEEHTEQEGA